MRIRSGGPHGFVQTADLPLIARSVDPGTKLSNKTLTFAGFHRITGWFSLGFDGKSGKMPFFYTANQQGFSWIRWEQQMLLVNIKRRLVRMRSPVRIRAAAPEKFLKLLFEAVSGTFL